MKQPLPLTPEAYAAAHAKQTALYQADGTVLGLEACAAMVRKEAREAKKAPKAAADPKK